MKAAIQILASISFSIGVVCAEAQTTPNAAPAQSAPAAAPAPQTALPSMAGTGENAGVKEVDRPLKINGQSRNISMMMVLKGDKDDINFVDVRRDFKDKIPDTQY